MVFTRAASKQNDVPKDVDTISEISEKSEKSVGRKRKSHKQSKPDISEISNTERIQQAPIPSPLPKTSTIPEEPIIRSESSSSAVKSPAKSDNLKPQDTAPTVIVEPVIVQPVLTEQIPKHDAVKYEFGGPVGVFFIMIGLPALLLGMYVVCNQKYCLSFNNFSIDRLHEQFHSIFPAHHANATPDSKYAHDWSALLDPKAFAVVLIWFLTQIVLSAILPGEEVCGRPLKQFGGKKLTYKMNGHLAFWLTMTVIVIGYPVFDSNFAITGMQQLPLQHLHDHYPAYLVSSIALSFILSTIFFNTGRDNSNLNCIYSYFVGANFNPRWANIDWKFICELRPGLFLWVVLNYSFMLTQFDKIGHVSLSMALINLLQAAYVWDAVHNESAILSTMDITHDHFGYMLVFGDLTWVPFFYSIQARYICDENPQLNWRCILAILGLFLVGMIIFRGANSQKDAFKRDPMADSVSHLEFIQTASGSKLLTSGWFGLARKINYTGDIIISLSWCMLCGFSSPIPYIFIIYFITLLVHRAFRDDEICSEKYGKDWDEYKRRVPYLFIPCLI